jgi:hypothetical protein
MTEGTVPVPPFSPSLMVMITYYLLGVIAFGGAEAAGVKPP